MSRPVPAGVAPPEQASRPALVGAAWGLFAVFIWAGWMVMTRLDLTRSGLTVFDITALRFGTAAVAGRQLSAISGPWG